MRTLRTYGKFFIIVCMLLPALSSQILPQEISRIRGFVTDSLNGEALPYANVFIEELKRGTSTDAYGAFIITNVPVNNTYSIVISYVGYKTKYLSIKVESAKIIEIRIALNPTGIQLQAVEKIGERETLPNETDLSIQRIDVKRLETLPKGIELDIFRSLQTVPGVQFVSDLTSRYYVRGGASNQNLVLINGIPIYNPFHALGMFSVIDPDMINSLNFYKGGWGAEYGGRLSSIMDIKTKDGNKINYASKATASYLTGKVSVEGPLPYGSFMITGRKSFSTHVLKKFLDGKSLPMSFYDVSAKAHYLNPDLIENGKFEFFTFRSEDQLDEKDPHREKFKWTNEVYGLKWIQFYNEPFFSEVTISLSKFSGELLPNLTDSKHRKNNVSDFSFLTDATYTFDSQDVIMFGTHVKIFHSDLLLTNSLGAIIDDNNSGGNFTSYFKYRFLRIKNFGLDAGARINLTGITQRGGDFYIEPRLSTTYRFSPSFSLKAAIGIYQQEITTVTDEREVISLFEPWIIIPSILNPPRAVHYIIGLETVPLIDMILKLETYYKSVKNLATVNDHKIFPSDPNLVSGTAESYGVELQLDMKLQSFYFNLSYSLSNAVVELRGIEYHPKYDSRHNLSLIASVDIGKGWNISSVWNYSSGRPFTEQLGYYNRFYIDNIYLDWILNSKVKPYLVLGEINRGRLPDYHRLDFSISKVLPLDFAVVTIDASIINVYDRSNLFYFKRDTGKRVNMLPFLPTASIKVEI